MKFLIIEDEEDLLQSIRHYLELEGNLCEVALNYQQAMEKIRVYNYDCLVVDIMLPDGNGLDIVDYCKQKHIQSGLVIVSARDHLDERIKGLEYGADDYITKPFHLAELKARISAVMRRRVFDGNKSYSIKEFTFKPDDRVVEVNQQPLSLTRKEFDLIVFLVNNSKRVISKETICEHLWGDQADMMDSFDILYSHLKNLRQKIEAAGGHDYIKSIYGVGYKFEIN